MVNADTPTLDELPSLIDDGLRLVDERIAASPSARIYDSIKAQLTYVRAVVHGEQQRDSATDDKLILGLYAAREFETSDPPFASVLFKIHYLYDRFQAAPVAAKTGARPSPPSGSLWLVVCIFVLFAAALLVPGVFLLVQRETGTPAQASVDDCQTTGAGKNESTHCSGTWIVGGSLLDGGRVVVGSVDGADQADVGKTIDVMLHADTAYSRSPATPLVLISFGIGPAVAAMLLALRLIWRPRVS